MSLGGQVQSRLSLLFLVCHLLLFFHEPWYPSPKIYVEIERVSKNEAEDVEDDEGVEGRGRERGVSVRRRVDQVVPRVRTGSPLYPVALASSGPPTAISTTVITPSHHLMFSQAFRFI